MRDQTRMLVLAALFAVVTAVANFIKIPIGVVPITLLFFATALSGVLLGPKWGAVSQTVYVVLGLVGLPIFTGGGGLGYVFQPSFGFLLGLIPAAWVIGMLSRWPWPPWPGWGPSTWWACPICGSSSMCIWTRVWLCPPFCGAACSSSSPVIF